MTLGTILIIILILILMNGLVFIQPVISVIYQLFVGRPFGF